MASCRRWKFSLLRELWNLTILWLQYFFKNSTSGLGVSKSTIKFLGNIRQNWWIKQLFWEILRMLGGNAHNYSYLVQWTNDKMDDNFIQVSCACVWDCFPRNQFLKRRLQSVGTWYDSHISWVIHFIRTLASGIDDGGAEIREGCHFPLKLTNGGLGLE